MDPRDLARPAAFNSAPNDFHNSDPKLAMKPESKDAELGRRGPEVEEPLLGKKAAPSIDGSGAAHVLFPPKTLIACLAYCAASASMILLNKHALASFGFHCPNALLAFQCALAVVLVQACAAAGLVRVEGLKRDLVLTWLPVNLIFVAMLGTGFYALRAMGIGMFTIWKPLTNVFTAVCDVLIFKRSYTWPVWGCLALITSSALVGAHSDARFSWAAYGWQLANCAITAAYTLYLRSVMDKVAQHTSDKQKMSEFSMVYYNNLLSLPFIVGLMWFFGEIERLPLEPALQQPMFLTVALVGGVLGFAISFTSLWYLSQVTATIYSLTGALNKVPIAILGIIAFAEPTNARNVTSIGVGLVAGVLLSFAKAK